MTNSGQSFSPSPMDLLLAQSTQVAHAMGMVAELPPHTLSDQLPVVVQVACLESFFSNLRLLVEFLVLPRKAKEIHRHDYLPGWDPEPSETLDRLKREYGFASEQVSHLAKSRVPTPGDILVNVRPEKLRLLAGLFFDEMKEFCKALSASGSAYGATFAAYVDAARMRLG